MLKWKYLCAMAVGAMVFAGVLAGCDAAVAPENKTSPQAAAVTNVVGDPAEPGSPHRFAAWAGRWTGVEGLYVDIEPTVPENYRLVMQYDLDHKGEFVGHDSEHGIKFTRNGEMLSLRRGGGVETGLKYLADKRDCLVVNEGEGYCRD
jgi:hypothetical protein